MVKAGTGRRPYGKAPPEVLERAVYRSLGAKRRETILGPGRGLDNAVISAGNGRVMIVTTDPVSMIPSLGPKTSAWLSVHLIASDYTTCGLAPEFAVFDFNFPREMQAGSQESYIREVGRACKELGVAIVAGHTGSYPGAGFTVIGGGMIFGFGERGSYVDPTMARKGDVVIMTKGAAIEAAASLANSFPEQTAGAAGGELTERAKSLVKSCSTVRDALIAASVGLGEGGVTSMHDATEGGVLGGLHEMAGASRHSIVVDMRRMLLAEEAGAVCSAFAIDPFTSLSEGTLLVTASEAVAGEVVSRLARGGISAAAIGTVKEGSGLWTRDRKGRLIMFRPGADPYWGAYARAAGLGLT